MSQGDGDTGPMIRELADQLGVPMLDVVRAAMSLGVRRQRPIPLPLTRRGWVADLVRLDQGDSPAGGHS